MDNRGSTQTAEIAAESGAAPGLGALVEVMGDLEADGDPARILRRVMTHMVEVLEADMAMVVQEGADGSYEYIRGLGSVADSEIADRLLAGLPRPLPAARALLDDGVIVVPLDTYHLVALRGGEDGVSRDALHGVELLARHAGQALENARLRDELEQKESLSTLGKAVRRVLHDLRNPIGRIHVAVDRANVPGADAETLRRMHAIIASAADDVLSMANEVSDFASTGKVTKIRITADSLLAALRDACARESVEVQCKSEHSGAIHCDPQKLLRALTRLVGSVHGYGRPVSGVETGDAYRGAVEVRVTQEYADTVITVGRDGLHVPEAMRARIFEPYAQVHQTGPGGLGLAVVRSITLAHGGEVAVLGDANQSWFCLRLPSITEG